MRTLFAVVVLALGSFAQSDKVPVAWRHSTKDDPLHGVSFDEFALDGKYLIPPPHIVRETPTIILHCSDGHFREGYLLVGAVVAHQNPKYAQLERRRDGKYDVTSLEISNDGTSLFFPGSIGLLDLLYGHWLPH